MRRLMFIGLAVLLLAGLASGQVIKYSVSKEADAVFAIGNVVELSASSEVDLCDAGVDAIGFVAMLEAYGAGPTTYALIVNAGPIQSYVTEAVTYDANLTPDAASPGNLKLAGVTDRVVAKALETIGANNNIKVMIILGALKDTSGARKWQIYDAGPTEYDAATDIFSDLSSSGGVDVAALDFYFTCTIDDHGIDCSNTGTVANFAWVIGGDITASKEPGATVYLLDRHFYQSQTVAMQATCMDPELYENFTVNVTVKEGLGIDGTGRITEALLTVVGTPRTTGP